MRILPLRMAVRLRTLSFSHGHWCLYFHLGNGKCEGRYWDTATREWTNNGCITSDNDYRYISKVQRREFDADKKTD